MVINMTKNISIVTLVGNIIKLLYETLPIISSSKIVNKKSLIDAYLTQISELQDIYFASTYPEHRDIILCNIKNTYSDPAIIIDNVVNHIRTILCQHKIITDITGRTKSLFSIWIKMNRKNICFDEMHDIIGIRIIVSSKDECYKVLKILNMNFNIITNKFRDFIQNPKNNGYQSIHLAFISQTSHTIEVQIRTDQMHELAVFGEAAHWQYKQVNDLKYINI
jgi:GTP pyrophosphokinase